MDVQALDILLELKTPIAETQFVPFPDQQLFMRFGPALAVEGEGYAQHTAELGRNEPQRFKAPRSTRLAELGVTHVCWIRPGEELQRSGSQESWVPCPHGGFLYLFGETAGETDERDCVFPVVGISEERHAFVDHSLGDVSDVSFAGRLCPKRG